ncbi:sulfatase-like hydrolase/transferase [Haladaptatus salinisoli]|uniref:sulfatase-like hydrolase/transferase n=1 Tax=Haladaptatus salinisoli TaxID=2884876 RepID=UPI001D0A32F3|nr:sulfatase-like hydrolase/transferase [Haladaptatus salinisoli]
MIDDAFESTLDGIDVDNIFIYVGDAVRWDALSPRIAGLGTTVKTVAASTYSPSSFASLVTGRYTPNHGVRTFSHRIPNDVFRFFDAEDVETTFVNSIFEYADREHRRDVDPIFSVLGVEPPDDADPFDDVEPPFIAMERGPGGHAPYGEFSGTATEYFLSEDATDCDDLVSDYLRSVELDANQFLRRIEELERRGLTDDTLVVYTSDHGELLGEDGMVGHSSPMRPELVYVPTVFIHPDLPERGVRNEVLHHADLLPTAFDVLDLETPPNACDGAVATKGLSNEARPSACFREFLPDSVPMLSGDLAYGGAWDANGGYAFARGSRADRLAVLGAKLFRSSKRRHMRRRVGSLAVAYARSETRYGTPRFDREEARRVLFESMRRLGTVRETDLSVDARQQLRNLGYVETR